MGVSSGQRIAVVLPSPTASASPIAIVAPNPADLRRVARLETMIGRRRSYRMEATMPTHQSLSGSSDDDLCNAW